MNAIVRHPALGSAETIRSAETVVATMATIIRNAVENRGECRDRDLERAGFTAAEIAEYGPIARNRVAPSLIRAGLIEDLAEPPEPSQAGNFTSDAETGRALDAMRDMVGAAEEAGWDVTENRALLEAARDGHTALRRAGISAIAPPMAAAEPPPFALPLRVVDAVGAILLEASDGEIIIRIPSMSEAKRARLAYIAASCNAAAGIAP